MATKRPLQSSSLGSAPEQHRPPAQLYLVAPSILATSDLANALAAALDAAEVAAVLLRAPAAAQNTRIETIAALVPTVQRRNVAVILDGDAALAARTGADGAHLTGSEALLAALPVLKPDRIAGAGGLATRHDAMVAAEHGADYVMFGEPGENGRPPFDTVVDRVEWWADVFETPCVGYAESLDEVAALAQAGADFVALGEFAFSDSRGPSAVIRAAAELLRELVK